MNRGLTGIIDQDREILLNIKEDQDLLKACILNKYFYKKVCNDMFFRNRLAKTYPNTLEFKPENETWKQFFLRMIYYIAKLKEEHNYQYTDGHPQTIYKIYKIDIRRKIYRY